MQTHAGLLLTEGLHFAEQDFLFGSVESVTPAFSRTVSLAEVQFQCVAWPILLHIIVGVDVEPVVILIGADKCPECRIYVEVRLDIKVVYTVWWPCPLSWPDEYPSGHWRRWIHFQTVRTRRAWL